MIDRFRGEHFFLSNMYPLERGVMTNRGLWVPTAETAYQANKFADITDHVRVVSAAPNPNDERVFAVGLAAKEQAHRLIEAGSPLVVGWDDMKYFVMASIVKSKFIRHPELRQRLVATGDQQIVEGNTWGDVVWGVDVRDPARPGRNWLGKILMEVRDDLRPVIDTPTQTY